MDFLIFGTMRILEIAMKRPFNGVYKDPHHKHWFTVDSGLCAFLEDDCTAFFSDIEKSES